jgi:hydrogenase nickel incorporation protein HypA/HybF
MHELSLCGAIAEIAERRARARSVEVIHVQVGQLRQVVPDTLAMCWSMVSTDTALSGSVLEIERVPALLRCRSCDLEYALGDQLVMACQGCGYLDVEVLAGDEFVVTALDLAGV